MIKYLNIGDEIIGISDGTRYNDLHNNMYYKIIDIDLTDKQVYVSNKGYKAWFNIEAFNYKSVARVNMIKKLLNE